MLDKLKNYDLHFRILFLLILVFSYLNWGHFKKEDEKAIAQKIQQQLNHDANILDEINTDLQEILLINGKDAFLKKALQYQHQYPDQFAFVLYENDSLSLWTDNHIPCPELLIDVSSNQFQNLGAFQSLVHRKDFFQFSLLSLQIIKHQYPWENDYLKNHLASYFDIGGDVEISTDAICPILDAKGRELFSIQLVNERTSKTGDISFIIFTLSLILLSSIVERLLRKKENWNPLLKVFILSFAVFLWYFFHLIVQLPEQLFNSDFFSPAIYAYNWVNNTLGNLFYMSLLLFLVVLYYLKIDINRNYRLGLIFLFVGIIFFSLYSLIYLMRSLVFDSQIIIDLYKLASLNLFSYLALGIIFLLQLSWVLLAYRWIGHFAKKPHSEFYLWIALIIFGFFPLFLNDEFAFQTWFIQLMGSIGILIIYYMQQNYKQRRLLEIIVYLVFFTFVTALVLNDINRKKEKLFREKSAINIDLENDPYLEAKFLTVYDKIQNDKAVKSILRMSENIVVDDSLLKHIEHLYFEEFKNEYQINLINCNEGSQITILPENFETSCYQYFQSRITAAESAIRKDRFYLVECGFQYKNYIGKIPILLDSIHTNNVFIEFVSKEPKQEIGLPAVLEKSHIFKSPFLKNYSFAYYNNGQLSHWRGRYDYKQKLADYELISYHDSFFVKDDYQHYIYSNAPGSVMIISLVIPGILQKLASFAFIFLFYSLLTFIIYALFQTSSLQLSISNFQGRLQYSMIVLLLFSFVFIGISSLYYIIYLNKEKNADNLMEKARSVLIELEHKLAGMEEFGDEDVAYVESLLVKFSDVFFTDITLFSREGKLLASSRAEVFSAELLSNTMDAQAFYKLNYQKKSFYIQQEKMGSQDYLSAYLPFRNQDNKSLAYLNLPYFAKQFELEREVSGFVVAFLNIYLFLLFIAIIITIFISRYLSKPLQMLKEKIKKVNLQDTNEKIEWNKKDEIGDLIVEYNRMVEELDKSAKKLALSQRESAWREMAQQIAHEIKNPLTPMKLNVQYLERAWDDGVEDYEERMKRITKALKEQIDVLADTASQFSSFAVVEKIAPQHLDIIPVIENVVAVFKAEENLSFTESFPDEELVVNVDKNQIIRVFNNVYKNAVQALSNKKQALIKTDCFVEDGHIIINICDNGIGISSQEIDRIFEPRFTTKTAGMGLGLALVKKMLINVNGKICVQSEEGVGTVFSIYLPLVSER